MVTAVNGDDVASSPPFRSPMAASSRRLQSPTFTLASNDDQLERAKARAAARAAAVRRISTAPASSPSQVGNTGGDLLGHDQIVELFQNCIRLASENKINQKNTWDLSLIDHIKEIVQVEEDIETNFQKASCTLEAGVKIYSLRVDSVHSEAYKVLGGINRVGREDDKENVAEVDSNSTEQAERLSKKEVEKKMSPSSTLESSFDALNIKKFDVAFTVDPLYHQTSAQFDEGGAKGLLLNNLGVYGHCRVVFDSFETPENCILCERRSDQPDLIDLSFAKESVEQMMASISEKTEITPTLTEIIKRFDEDNSRPQCAHDPVVEEVMDESTTEMEGDSFDVDVGAWNFEGSHPSPVKDSHPSPVNDSTASVDHFPVYEDDVGEYSFDESTTEGKIDKIAGLLSLSLGLTSKSNAWAGPEHWKYRKAKGLERIPAPTAESEVKPKKVKNKKQGPADIEFTNSLDNEKPDIFAPPRNPKSLLLPLNRAPCNIRLPEDCHYKPESLVKLFILPNVLCLGKKSKRALDDSKEQFDSSAPCTSWDNESVCNELFDVDNTHDDVEDSGTLVNQPRQVAKIDIQYDKVSKQVDVHALKEVLWGQIQRSIQVPEKVSGTVVSFKQILHQFPKDCSAAPAKDLSPHLFFICLLHLANEHCLSLHDHPGLDELDIHVPDNM